MSHVPPYVYVLFLVLIWMGVSRCFARTIRIERLLIMPTLMIALGVRGYFGLFPSAGPIDLLAGICGSAVGLLIGHRHARTWNISVDHSRRSISLPGDVMMLAVILATFFFEFALHYTIESGMIAATTPIVPIVAAAIWTMFIGMSAGRNLNLTIRYALNNTAT